MIGLLPCAGNATRIHGLPKYLLPVPGGYLLQLHVMGMRAAGCRSIEIGISPANMFILEPYTYGADMYVAEHYDTMTQTVLSAFGYGLPDESVLFSMPDTYWGNPNVYEKLCAPIWHGTADVTVALFEARPGQHAQGGMCRVEGNQIVEVVDKPTECDWPYIWGALAWTPDFWQHLNPADPHVGYGLPRAIADGLDVRAVVCEGGFWDCGTEQSYFELCSLFHANQSEKQFNAVK